MNDTEKDNLIRIFLQTEEGAKKIADSMRVPVARNVDYRQVPGKLYHFGDLPPEGTRTVRSKKIEYILPLASAVRHESMDRMLERITSGILDSFNGELPEPVGAQPYSKTLLRETLRGLDGGTPQSKPLVLMNALSYANLVKSGLLQTDTCTREQLKSGGLSSFEGSDVIVTKHIESGFILCASRHHTQIRRATEVEMSVLEHSPPRPDELSEDGEVGGRIVFEAEAKMELFGDPEYRWLSCTVPKQENPS